MHSVVMCGGKGSRLGPLGTVINKSLLPVRGKPVIQHVIETLSGLGSTKIVLLANHLADQIEGFFASCDLPGVEIVVRRDRPGTKTTGEALKQTLQSIGSTFYYAHGNICLPDHARETFAQACRNHTERVSLIATSTAPHALTHPHVEVIGNRVALFGPRTHSRNTCSVGLARYELDHLCADTNEAVPAEYLIRAKALEDGQVLTIDIGKDWAHVENLEFYK